MSDRDNYKTWEDRGQKVADDFTDRPVRTVGKWLAYFIGLSIALSLVFGAISWIGSWGDEAKRVTSPQNVREQNTQVIQDFNDMKAAAANYCGAGGTSTGQPKKAEKDDDDPTLVEDPTLAYAATYRRIQVDYDRRMANLYEAQAVRKLPLPSNLRSYPKEAPSLQEAAAEAGC